MARTFSTPAIKAMMDANTDKVFVLLVTFWHGSEIYRCCLNTEDVISRGQQFVPTYFQIRLPEVSDAAPQGCEIQIDNVDNRMVDMLRRVVTPVQVKLELVLADSPDVVEVTVDDLVLREATWNAQTISGRLMVEDMLNAGFPGNLYEARTFPGIF